MPAMSSSQSLRVLFGICVMATSFTLTAAERWEAPEALAALECPSSWVFASGFESAAVGACPEGSMSLSEGLAMVGLQEFHCIPPFSFSSGGTHYEACDQTQCDNGATEGCSFRLTSNSISASTPQEISRDLRVRNVSARFRPSGSTTCTLTADALPTAATIWMDTVSTPGGGIQWVAPLGTAVDTDVSGTSGCMGHREATTSALKQRIEALLMDAMLIDVAPLSCEVVCPSGQ
jgi:hypothetical protein